MSKTPKILILGTAEWDSPIATNQHYIARELAKSAQVVFVESIALRTPKVNATDAKRVVKRLRRVAGSSASPQRSSRPVPDNVRVASPVVVPLHNDATYAANKRLLNRTIKPHLFDGKEFFDVVWTYTPVTYGWHNKGRAVVYHCVDLLGEVDGISTQMIHRNESKLAQVADQCVATSPVVAEHLRAVGFENPKLWKNVADVDVFDKWDIGSTRNNAVVFGGNLTSDKLDAALIEALAAELAGRAEVVLAGPIDGKEEPDGPIHTLLKAPNVRYVGSLSLEALGELYATSQVGLIPYRLNGYTRGVSPLKTFEYLSAGMPVVSTPVPAVEAQDDLVYRESDPEGFIKRVVSLLDVPEQHRLDAKQLGQQHSWKNRGEEARSLVQALLS